MSNSIDKLEQIKRLRNGRGVQYLLNKASAIFENPMLIHDMEYKLVASPDSAVVDDPIWNEFMVHGRVSKETIEFFMQEGFIDEVAGCDGVTYLTSAKLEHNRIFGQLYNDEHIPVADLCAVACNKPFEDDTPALIRAICKKISKELSRSAYYQSFGRIYQKSLFRELLEGGILDRKIDSDHIANLYRGLNTNIYLVVADITQCGQAHADLAYFEDLFIRRQPEYKYVVYQSYIVILMSTDESQPDVRAIFGKLYNLFKQNDICAGISSCLENLYELPVYYHEAVSAMEDGLTSNSSQRFYVYDKNKHQVT